MKHKRIPYFVYIFIPLFLIVVAHTAPGFAKVFDPVSFYLKNGLHIVVVSDRRAPAVSHMLWYKVGSADDPKGKSGLHTLLNTLCLKELKDISLAKLQKLFPKTEAMKTRSPVMTIPHIIK